jgi:hypothetical protein
MMLNIFSCTIYHLYILFGEIVSSCLLIFGLDYLLFYCQDVNNLPPHKAWYWELNIGPLCMLSKHSITELPPALPPALKFFMYSR